MANQWRYRCTHCDSVQLYERTKGGGNQLSDADSYYCQNCQQHSQYKLDKKTDKLVS